MKQLLLSLFLMGFCYLFITTAGERKQMEIATTQQAKQFTIDDAINLPDRVVQLPVGENVYFSESLCRYALNDLQELGIISIVRLNGNGKDAGCLTVEEEAELAYGQNIRMTYLNIDGSDDIAGAVQMMNDGNTWVHCKHGAHRAALAAGCFLVSKGIAYQEAIEIIGWTQGNKPVITDPRYAKYVNILRQWADRYYLQRKQILS